MPEQIPIKFMTAVIHVSALKAQYPEGLGGFLRDFPGVRSTPELVGVPFMSGGDMNEFIDQMKHYGLHVGKDLALADMMLGTLEAGEVLNLL